MLCLFGIVGKFCVFSGLKKFLFLKFLLFFCMMAKHPSPTPQHPGKVVNFRLFLFRQKRNHGSSHSQLCCLCFSGFTRILRFPNVGTSITALDFRSREAEKSRRKSSSFRQHFSIMFFNRDSSIK